MKPMNRHIKIGLVEHSPSDTRGVLMPEGYKAIQEWQAGVVKAVAESCEGFDRNDTGTLVVFPGNMLLSVDVLGEQHHFVQENYIVCRSEARHGTG